MNKNNDYRNETLAELDGKVVIVDTSSLLLSGTDLIKELPPCTLVIPTVVVGELENKRSSSQIGFLAREWLRLLEFFRTEDPEKLSVGIPYKGLIIRVESNHSSQTILPSNLQNRSNDSTVLAVAVSLKNEGNNVVLLSNDLPMRVHATVDLGLPAFEFSSESKVYSGIVLITVEEPDYAEFLTTGEIGDLLTVSQLEELSSNSYALVKIQVGEEPQNVDNFLYVRDGASLTPLTWKNKSYGITARSLEQNAALLYLKKPCQEVPLVSLGGCAGTGKTLMALASGLQGVLKDHKYEKVMVFRSLHEMGQGQELGFLPGDLSNKIEPWGGAIGDALDVIVSSSTKTDTKAVNLRERLSKIVEVSPITFLRGRSISNTFIIIEEAQNFSRSELLNIISRTGAGSKVVLTWDPDQVDNKFLQSGKKADIWGLIELMRGNPLFSHITLSRSERSPLAESATILLNSEKQF